MTNVNATISLKAHDPTKDNATQCNYSTLLNGLISPGQHVNSYFLEIIMFSYEILSFIHMVFLLSIFIYVVGSIMRKHRHTYLQWFNIGSMALLNAVEITFYYTFTRETISDEKCYYPQKMYYGVIYCAYYTISTQIGYSLIVLLKQIKDFVDKQELPS